MQLTVERRLDDVRRDPEEDFFMSVTLGVVDLKIKK